MNLKKAYDLNFSRQKQLSNSERNLWTQTERVTGDGENRAASSSRSR